MKPSYKPPVNNSDIKGNDNNSTPVKDATPKGRMRHGESSTQDKYPSPAKVPKHMKEPNAIQQPSTGLRRSPRVPRVTAKYLESIKAELKDLDGSD